ncbi:hypothetical protein P8C59_008764 [Phyllachora maydis]|uniref:Uncharacterized protein n=1 Tax=Phyllachora maydis TaxID=1825666 RepID=A0AAD9MIT6_9PEZI|nr:hypothetical protein P8C59_008764 [Phyllachora maydis]
MFLHAGASLHGHEYSNRSVPAPQPPRNLGNLRSPLFRNAIASTKSRLATVTGDESVRQPALRHRPASDYIPRPVVEQVVRFMEPESDKEPGQSPRRQVLVPPVRTPERKTSQQVTTEPSSRPQPISLSEDLASESELSDATQSTTTNASPASGSVRRKQKRAPRKGTTFHLGYPAPKLLSKKKVVQKVLPRLVLQLQRVFEDGRSRPVLEVFPATRIAGPVMAPRMAQRFPGIFRVKHQLCYDDLVLVQRDAHGLTVDEQAGVGDDGESLEDRKLLGVFSPLKNSDAAEIVLEDGAVWTATPSRTGSYDFVHVDAQGNMTTARWAKRSLMSTSPITSSPVTAAASPSAQEARFTFSMINPLSRRHAVMATLTNTSLNVQDSYASVSASHSRYPPSRSFGRSTSEPLSTRSNGSASSDCEDTAGATSTGAAFMHKRIERNSQPWAVTAPVTAAAVVAAGQKYRRTSSRGVYVIDPEPSVEKELGDMDDVSPAGLVDVVGGDAAEDKKGLRLRLAKWFYRLGGR